MSLRSNSLSIYVFAFASMVGELEVILPWTSMLDQFPAVSSSYRTLASLKIEDCGGLKFLFSYSMAKSLRRLYNLEICNCKSVEAIFNKKNQLDKKDQLR